MLPEDNAVSLALPSWSQLYHPEVTKTKSVKTVPTGTFLDETVIGVVQHHVLVVDYRIIVTSFVGKGVFANNRIIY